MNIVIDDTDLDPFEIRELFQRVLARDVRSIQVGEVKLIFGHGSVSSAEKHLRLFGAQLHN